MTMASSSHSAPHALQASELRIGYVGHDVPIELILAAGATPIGIHGRAGQPTPHADRYVETTFSPASRSIAEQWLSGALDDLAAVVFSRSDDSAQRLYYYLCELQRRGLCGGPQPLLYDIANWDRGSSLAHTIDSTRQLARELGSATEELPRAMQRVHERAELLICVRDSTLAQSPARGSFAHGLLRAADRDWSEAFDRSLRKQDSSPAHGDAIRLMLIGSSPADESLHETAERRGGNIVATATAATPQHTGSVASGTDAFEQIARRCRAHSWRKLLQNPEAFCERAAETRVAGVILWIVTEDAGLAWASPRIERALRTRGVPVLSLTMQPWSPTAQSLNAIAQFTDELRAQA